MSFAGWNLNLADGSQYSWSEDDGVYSEAEARERMLAQEPDAVIVSVEQIEIVLSTHLSDN